MGGKTLSDLFHHTLSDVYFAETAILKALPNLAAAAGTEAVRTAIETHRVQTIRQVERLEAVFGGIDRPAEGTRCAGILALLDEGDRVVEAFADSPALDAALIAALQSVEHYEIARYGALVSWARELGLDDAADTLEETLDEEEETDQLLTELAETLANARAAA